jgi:hypothetical protein
VPQAVLPQGWHHLYPLSEIAEMAVDLAVDTSLETEKAKLC